MEKIIYQIDRIKIDVSGEKEGFSLAGNYEIDGTGNITNINVTARTESEGVISDKGFLTYQMGSPVFMVTETARKEELTRTVTMALLQYYDEMVSRAVTYATAVSSVADPAI